MKLEDIDYEFLLTKYQSAGISGKQLEYRLKLLDPYTSIDSLRLTLTHLHF